MLGPLLLVSEQLRGKCVILLSTTSAWSRPCNRTNGHPLIGDADEELGGAAYELHPIEDEVVHVW